jgi:membrane protein implicated in regulation of membrane protease activity
LLGLAVMAGGAAAVAIGAFVPQLTGWWFVLLMIAIAAAVAAALVWTLWRSRMDDRGEANRAADLLHDVLTRSTPLEAAIASLRTSWKAFDLAWRGP